MPRTSPKEIASKKRLEQNIVIPDDLVSFHVYVKNRVETRLPFLRF